MTPGQLGFVFDVFGNRASAAFCRTRFRWAIFVRRDALLTDIVRSMDQSELDSKIQVYYASVFDESERLGTRSAQGRLEFERVQELIGSRIPAQSRVLDVGGATGVHAAALSNCGHEVVLIDPVASHIDVARRHGTFTAEVGDARDLGASSMIRSTWCCCLVRFTIWHRVRSGFAASKKHAA